MADRDDDFDDDFQEDVLEDDGVLEPSDSLLTDDLDDDPLDTGLTAAERWSAGQRFGTTAAEAVEGESLDQLLAEEEPEPDPALLAGRWDEAEPRSGRLIGEDGDRSGSLLGRDVGIDAGASSAEEAAVHVTDEDADREAELDDPLDEDLDEALANLAADEARDAD
ncbi:DUF5709 domain-containing protein [Planotetraspora kaengkrachanensis]|uniref:DUF5709 domain-containing protein n=1 Tax=Planotetraspora kaengkrachanensis TaxID=575193 RepID=A0A8J3VAC4_9ACTN|nr:DUF5709 domain-containing protein [Planotetraspora kaengkrachanensis]GIG82709.1 hypothetical protein Pka01_58360 [Planotetraspora kaengkrachanensis]